MTTRWMAVALFAGWLGLSGLAQAQCDPACHFTIGAGYLELWTARHTIPALVTRGNISDPVPGALGQPGTSPLIGPGDYRPASGSGVRLTLDWMDPEKDWGVGGSFFASEEGSVVRQAGGPGTGPNLTLSRPYFDPNFGLENADPLVVPDVQGGNLELRLLSRLLGADVAVRFNQSGCTWACDRLAPLIGLRFLHLDEKLLISENVFDLPDTAGNLGNVLALNDKFETTNRFYGGQLGLESDMRFGPVLLKLTGKVGLGVTAEEVTISGDTVIQGAGFGVVADRTRGLLVQPANGGRYTRNSFGVVPEFGANLVLEATECVHIELGYSGLYWNKVARPENQIDTVVNVGAVGAPAQFGTSPHPIFPFGSSSFWAHSIHAGLRFSF